jgi:hypothetical protein
MGDDFGDFDIIVADNLIHFFDGEQILNFLVTYFNLLKPGAKLYLFFNGRAPHISREMALAKNNIASLFVNTIYEISSLAEAYNKEILFPGLILDEWLLKRSEVLTHILEQKPNKSTQQNFINFQIIELLARAIGFSSISREFYELVMQEDKIAFKRVHEENHSVALVLTKDPEITAHKSKNDLDSQLVDSCVNATQLMKDFIYGDGNLIFIAPYPYVQKGPNFCKNAQCKKKGTFMCGRCKKVKYCSKECQSVDWRSAHNRSCLRQ